MSLQSNAARGTSLNLDMANGTSIRFLGVEQAPPGQAYFVYNGGYAWVSYPARGAVITNIGDDDDLSMDVGL